MKIFRKLAIFAMVICCSFVFLGVTKEVNAVTVISDTLDFKECIMPNKGTYTDTYEATQNDKVWSISNANNNNNLWDYIKMGSKKAASVGFIDTKFAISNTISVVKMEITAVTASAINGIKLISSTDANFTQSIVETPIDSISTGSRLFTIASPASNRFYRISVDCKKAASNGIITISKVEYCYEASSSIPQLTAPTVELDSKDIIGDMVTGATKYEIGVFETTTAINPIISYSINDITELYTIPYTPQGTFFVKVKSIGDGTNYLSSDWSSSIGSFTTSTILTKTVSEMNAAVVETGPRTYYQVTGIVSNITATEDFTLVNPSSSTSDIFVEGLLDNNKQAKTLDELGIKAGDTVTLIGYRGTFNTSPSIEEAYFVNRTINYSKRFESLNTMSSMKISYTTDTGKTEVKLYTLVTDASTLQAGDTVIIAAATENFAMSTDQRDNNRGQAAITKSGNTIVIGSDTQKFTLEVGTKANTFAFNSGNGYIYAASSGSNHLRTEDEKSDNSSWTISIEDGTTSITAQGTNTRNNLKYNSGSGIFSCYAGGQGAVCIYKESTVEQTGTVITPNNVSTRFGACIEKAMYDGINAEGSEVTYGVVFIKNSELGDVTLTQSFTGAKNVVCTPAQVALANGTSATTSDTGEFYQFAVVITNIPSEAFGTKFTAVCYANVDGVYHYMLPKTISTQEIAESYVLAEDTSTYAEHVDALKAVAGIH